MAKASRFAKDAFNFAFFPSEIFFNSFFRDCIGFHTKLILGLLLKSKI